MDRLHNGPIECPEKRDGYKFEFKDFSVTTVVVSEESTCRGVIFADGTPSFFSDSI